MAISPAGVLALRSASGIKAALLGNEDKGTFGSATIAYRSFRFRNLLKGPTDMDGPRLVTDRGLPRDRPIQCPVEFKHARAAAETQ